MVHDPRNFLAKSSEYVRSSNLPSTAHDYLELADEVLLYLNVNFEKPKGEISWAKIAQEVTVKLSKIKGDKEYKVSRETIRRMGFIFYYTARWLKGDDKDRENISTEIKGLSNSYANFIRKGIACMVKDGFISWDSIENPTGADRFEVCDVEPEPLMFGDVLDQARSMYENLENSLKKEKQRTAGLLDEIRDLTILARVSQNRLEEIERLKPFENKCKDLEKKVSDLEAKLKQQRNRPKLQKVSKTKLTQASHASV